MKNCGEPPAKRLKIEEDVLDEEEEEEMEEEDVLVDVNVLVDVDVLGDEDILFDADVNEEEEDREEEIVNGFNFNNVSAEECIEFLMGLLHVWDYEQLFHILEEAVEEEEAEE